jgi:hypothetical protein
MSWADEFIVIRIIAQVFHAELVLAQDFWFAVMMGILVKGVVLDVPPLCWGYIAYPSGSE